MRRALGCLGLLFAFALCTAAPAAAQATHPLSIVEVQTGYAGFVDEVWIKRTIVGGGVRDFISPRIALGPEFQYLHAPGSEHDWTLTGNISFDIWPDTHRRFTPYLVAGGGLVSQTQLVGTGPFTSKQGTFSGGAGARISLGRRWFIAPEYRMGIEPEVRIGLTIGLTTGK